MEHVTGKRGRSRARFLSGAVITAILVGYLYLVVGDKAMSSTYLRQSSLVEKIVPFEQGPSSSSGKSWKAVHFRKFPQPLKFKDRHAKTRPAFSKLHNDCTQWVVITTIFAPTKLIKQVAKLDDWCAVVVSDVKQKNDTEWFRLFPKKGKHNVVFLSVDDQKSLPYTIYDHIPFTSFGRKNLGFMFAIHHGAKVIYDTDDDNDLLGDGRQITKWASILKGDAEPSKFKVRLTEWRAQSRIFNPYMAFKVEAKEPSQHSAFAWPRGTPLALIQDSRTSVPADGEDKAVEPSKVSLLQFLADNDPDMDAMYRLTRTLPLRFPVKDLAYATPPGVYFPFNAQATMFRSEAFFGMLLPVTVHGRVTDIWRAYFLERIIWNIGKLAAYGEAIVEQYRNVHSHLNDFASEVPLYLRSDDLVRYLSDWTPESTTVPGHMEELYVAMYEIGIVELDDVIFVQAWLSDLQSSGHVFPTVVTNKGAESNLSNNFISDERAEKSLSRCTNKQSNTASSSSANIGSSKITLEEETNEQS